MTARPDSRATPAPTASNIAAVILASAMSGTLSICDAPTARQAAIISFVVLFLAPATDTVPSSGTLDRTCQARCATAANWSTIAASRRAGTGSETLLPRVNGERCFMTTEAIATSPPGGVARFGGVEVLALVESGRFR